MNAKPPVRVLPRAVRAAIPALAVTGLLAVPAAAPAKAGGGDTRPRAVCAGKLCKRWKPGTPSCHRFDARAKVSRCFIRRAARHYGQSTTQALAIAWRESRYDWRVTNTSSGAAGLYQFMPGTWAHTPYRRHSPHSPRWAPLAAMWMWKHGGMAHWSL